MITNPRFINPFFELNLTDDQINNSIFQQVMSKFRPEKFSLRKELDTFIPRTQLEKLVIANLKKHKVKIYPFPNISMTAGKGGIGRQVSDGSKYLKKEK